MVGAGFATRLGMPCLLGSLAKSLLERLTSGFSCDRREVDVWIDLLPDLDEEGSRMNPVEEDAAATAEHVCSVDALVDRAICFVRFIVGWPPDCT